MSPFPRAPELPSPMRSGWRASHTPGSLPQLLPTPFAQIAPFVVEYDKPSPPPPDVTAERVDPPKEQLRCAGYFILPLLPARRQVGALSCVKLYECSIVIVQKGISIGSERVEKYGGNTRSTQLNDTSHSCRSAFPQSTLVKSVAFKVSRLQPFSSSPWRWALWLWYIWGNEVRCFCLDTLCSSEDVGHVFFKKD